MTFRLPAEAPGATLVASDTRRVMALNCVGMKSLHEMVADKLERDPSLLRIPLENIDRWLANGHTSPHRLEQWRQIILRAQASPEGFAALLHLLRAEDEAAARLKDFAPFAGTLTREERRRAAPSCAYHF